MGFPPREPYTMGINAGLHDYYGMEPEVSMVAAAA
jgi:hypothetical protein